MLRAEDVRHMTLAQIKAFPDPGDAFICLLEQDDRKSVRAHADVLKRRRVRAARVQRETAARRAIEETLYEAGYSLICGIDEVGRGPLAGPVVAAAVIMPRDTTIPGINDSKKLSRARREKLDGLIREQALSYAYGSVGPQRIDAINILNATKKAMIAAVARLKSRPSILLIDALRLNTQIPERAVVHGDAECYAIGAASIIAKVRRDAYMIKLAEKYPQYGFEKNMGYGTAEHIDAIRRYGLTPEHRRSFCTNFI